MASAHSPEAQEAFGRLLDLSPSRRERRELQAAGVAQSAINSLYPASFVDIAPGLIAHIDTVPGGHIFKRVPTKPMNAYCSAADLLLSDETVRDRRMEIMSDSGWVDLRLHLRATWKTQSKGKAPAEADSHATLLRIAYWYMTRGPLLPDAVGEPASKLMVAVADAWQLPRA